MPKPLIVISGKNGQLGCELEELSIKAAKTFEFLFTDRKLLDLSNPDSIGSFFCKYHPAYFINAAAYTAVDKAETEQAAAYRVNAEAVGEIAQFCCKLNCVLIQLSTDYVFKGDGNTPYAITAKTDPVNYYGYTKWLGENLALQNNPASIIIRTSWLYSSFGNNFVKTMLRLMKERESLSVVNDQTGSPTYAADLAHCILDIIQSIEKGNRHFGTFHFSNEASISWFEFANAIASMGGMSCKISPIPSSDFPTTAKRPVYSVMDKSRIISDYGLNIKEWRGSLKKCIQSILA